MRPGEPARSTMRFWIQTCTQCGASAPDLATLPGDARTVMDGPAFAALRGTAPVDAFLRWAAIARGCGKNALAAEATLQAAWLLDDAGEDGSALRLAAIVDWGAPDGPQATLRQVDVLRRAGEFDRAAALLDRVTEADESTAAISAYQRELIAARDRERHGIASALRPPARRPHVSHGTAPAKQGFWARLRG